MKQLKKLFLLCGLIILPSLFAGIINFRGNSSYINVFPGTNFVINQPLASMNGKLIRQIGGTISGTTISFVDGLFINQNNGQSLLLTGIFDATSKNISLGTNNFIKDSFGRIVNGIQISGTGSRIQGQPTFTAGITILDAATTTTFSIQSSLTQNISMNGGVLWLDDTLTFGDNNSFLGTGTVNLNGHRVQFGGQNFTITSTMLFVDGRDITLNAEMDVSTPLTFNGINTIQGNCNILKLLPGGSLIIGNDSTLYLTDVVLKGLGVGGGTIVFSNANSQLVLCNSTVALTGNFSTTQGSVIVNGPTTVVVKNFKWAFTNTSLLQVDGVTMWLDKAGAPTFGNVTFGAANLSLINSGTISGAPTQADIDALQTSTGFLQSEIDACCSALRTSTGFLQSEIDSIFSRLSTSTGFLQSEIDSVSTMVTMLKTSTGFLQSEIDACCSAQSTSTGFLQSEIDALNSMIVMLKTSTGFLQSQIDLFDPAMIVMLRTSTGFLQSEIDSVSSMVTMLKTSTGFLQSQIDVNSSMISQLRTSTGFLQSEIDSIFSRLSTSTGFLQSEIDACCSAQSTSTGILQSEIDALNSMVTMLKTSTGYLQSQIDQVIVSLECCAVSLLSTVTQINDVQSTDWDFDGDIVALGMNNNGGGDSNTLQIYRFNGESLVQTDSRSFVSYDPVTSVRFSRTKHLLAVTQNATGANAGLTIYTVNEITGKITFASSTQIGNDIESAAWSTDGLSLVVGRNIGVISGQLIVYNVSTSGILSAPIITSSTGNLVERQALDWSRDNFFAVGELQGGSNNALEVYTFDPVSPSLFVNASTQVPATPGDAATRATVLTVGWNTKNGSIVAVGLNNISGSNPQELQAWLHDPGNGGAGAGTLTYASGVISEVGTTLHSLDWSPDGLCISEGKTPVNGSTFRTFSFDLQTYEFVKRSESGSLQTGSVLDVNYNFEGFIINGSQSGLGNPPKASLYSNCANFQQSFFDSLQSQIDSTNSMVTMLKTSTGYLQSEIDFILIFGFAFAADIQSQIDSLKTSTGFLQSQIDELKTFTFIPVTDPAILSRLDELDMCCAAVRTSTGFLQSQIDDLRTFTFIPVTDPAILSRLDDLEVCCAAVRTSTGFLQSELDATTSLISFLSGQFTVVIQDIFSSIDSLQTSTGYLQSQIDFVLASLECCAVNFVLSVTQTNDVQSSDWSYDGNFVALGMNNNVGGDANTLKIYRFDGTSMILTDSRSFSVYNPVTSVRFNPVNYLLAVSQNATGSNNGVTIFSVNPTTGQLTLTSFEHANANVESLAWRSDGATIAFGRNIGVLSAQLHIHDVSSTGIISGPITSTSTSNLVSRQALNWKQSDYIVVGEVQGASGNALEVYRYDPTGPTLFVNASTQVPATPGVAGTRSTVNAVDWNDDEENLIAVGLSNVSGTAPQSLQVWEHDPGNGGVAAGTLTYKSGASDNVNSSVNAAEWSTDGLCLAVGKTPVSGGTFLTYSFDKSTFELIKRSEFGNLASGSVLDVQYNPVNDFIIDGSATGTGSVPKASLYAQCGNFEASTFDSLQSQIDFVYSSLRTSTGFLQSEIDALSSMIVMLKTSTGFLQSEVDFVFSNLATSTGFLQSEIDACCSAQSTSTGLLQSEIDALNSMIIMLKTSTGFLQSEVDFVFSNLATSTGFLQSEIDACCSAQSTSTGLLQSEIDALNSMIIMLKTSTGFLQSEIDASASFLQAEIDLLNSAVADLQTTTGFLQSEIDACCSAQSTSTGFLQSEIDALNSMIVMLKTSTGFLQSEIDACCSAQSTSTGFLQSEIDALNDMIVMLKTSTGFLQSEIDSVFTSLSTSTGFLQSELDLCCSSLRTSTGFLQSQIDNICSLTCIAVVTSVISRLDSLESIVEELITSTGFLQSELDLCCSSLRTSTGFLQSQIDALQAQIDSCCTGTALTDCIITVTGTIYLMPSMLPAPHHATVFRFSPCFGRMHGPNPETPRVIVDPVVFGSNRIPLNPNTRLIFQGEGFVEVHNGIVWDFKGTPFTDMTDWPALIIEYLATMVFPAGTTVTFGGMAGCYIIRQGAQMLLENPNTQVIFGENIATTEIVNIVQDNGLVSIDDPTSFLSYGAGTFDVLYQNHATLDVLQGTLEMNCLQGASFPGLIRNMTFDDGSSIRIVKTGDPSVDGLWRLAPNINNVPTNFDNRAGIIFNNDSVFSGGNIQYRTFNGGGGVVINTTLVIQNNPFAIVRPILDIFMELTYIVRRALINTPDATILVRLGTIPNVDQDGRLAAYCPQRDGTIVGLCQGDHDVFYDTISGQLVVRGRDFNGVPFTISGCDESTRDPAPTQCVTTV